MKKTVSLATIILMLMASAAEAHVGQGVHLSFAHGFMHPIGGLDHILVMVAVGMFAALLGGRARWLIPTSFVSMMVFGGLFGISGVQIPLVEIAISVSVIVLGAIIALQKNVPLTLAMGLVGFFAVFHGFAHGSEMPADASWLGYGFGFVVATAMLHGAGLGLGLLTKVSSKIMNVGGSAMALAGLGLLAGVL